MLERDQRELIGMVITAIVTVIGITGMLLTDAGPDANVITASVVSRAGATSAPSERPIEIRVPKTVPAFR